MKRFPSIILGVCALAVAVGCKTTTTDKLTTSHIVMVQGTNRAEIHQPKDSSWDELSWNSNGIRITGYVSAANAGAIRLESERAKAASESFNQGLQLGRDGLAAYIRMQGIPVPVQPTQPVVQIPATVSTNR